jgi:hypothetical protein
LGDYLVAGDFGLLGAILTIVVVLVAMLEVGVRLAKKVTVPQAVSAPVAPAAAK